MRSMRKLAALVGLAAVTSCGDFLDSPKAVSDPNAPTAASANQLFAGVQANLFAQQEGPVAMIVCQWMQQCAGINARFAETQGNYGIAAGDFDDAFAQIYSAGGLLGIRAVQSAVGSDAVYKGVTEVAEAMNMMFAADVWGDVAYSQAVGASSTPAYDGQMAIYDALLTLLDKAITDLGGSGTGPGPVDLVYGGDKAKWIQAAHTLKARIYLRRVEKLGAGQYANALAEARLGISAPANDWLTKHTASNSERNLWQQFQTTSGFGSDLVAGSALVNIMNAQADARRSEYFGTNAAGAYVGFDVTTGTTPTDQVSDLLGGRSGDPEFSQPIITYDETQLIIAEAALQGSVIDRVAAAAAFNNVRARHGKGSITSALLTLNDVMTEKYITLFQNLEVWNDYKRTCLPVLHPARAKPLIPGRLFYGETEVQTNPQPQNTADNFTTKRNENDPNACPP